MLSALEARLRRAARAVAIVGLAGLMLIGGVTVADVLGRWLLNTPLAGAHDFNQVAIVLVVAACFPAGVLERQHIAIRFVGEWFGPRAVAWLDVFGSLVLLLVLGGIAWQAIVYTGEIFGENQHTWIIGLRYWPWWSGAAALFSVSVVLQALVSFVQIARAAMPGDDRPADAIDGVDEAAVPEPMRRTGT